MTERYLVLGNPIEHSLSPVIHAQFAKQTRQAIEYDRRLVAIGDFDATIADLQKAGFAGVNVTSPFKENAYAIADRHSATARQAGTANTLVFRRDGTIDADNTDGVGLVSDITDNHQYRIADKTVLIVGAGGAVCGVLPALLDERPAAVTLVNRTQQKARRLQQRYKDALPITVSNFAALAGQSFDLVINSVPLGLQNKIAPLPDGIFAPSALAYDMMYGAASLPFRRWAESQGAALILDGLGMLVNQAAESFYIWRNVRPDTAAVIHYLRAECAAVLA